MTHAQISNFLRSEKVPFTRKNSTKTLLGSAIALAALASAPAFSEDEFKLSEGLSVTGFVDMSWTMTDPDEGSSEQSLGLDQFEIDFLYDFGEGLTSQVDLEYQDNGSGEEVDIEQAFINYAVSESVNVKAGRFLSYSGWETEEPTGLMQFSGTGYAKYFYGAYQQGVSVNYAGSGFSLAASVVNDLGDLEGEARDSEQPAVELMAAIMPSDAVTIKAFYMTDKLEGTDETSDLFNIWASYAVGPMTFAAEYNSSENAPAAGVGVDATGYLLLANYAKDKFAITFRYHEWELENDTATTEEMSGFTVSPSYAVTDNLLIVTEVRQDEDDISGGDSTSFAVEALLTF